MIMIRDAAYMGGYYVKSDPVSFRRSSGKGRVLKLPEKVGVSFDGFSEMCMAAFCNRCHVRMGSGSFVTLKQNKEYEMEEYFLQVMKDSIRVEAGSEIGVIRALTTVYQLSEDPQGSPRRKEAIEYFNIVNSGMSKEGREQAVETTAPNKEFSQSYMNKFFKKSDMFSLLKSMMKK